MFETTNQYGVVVFLKDLKHFIHWYSTLIWQTPHKLFFQRNEQLRNLPIDQPTGQPTVITYHDRVSRPESPHSATVLRCWMATCRKILAAPARRKVAANDARWRNRITKLWVWRTPDKHMSTCETPSFDIKTIAVESLLPWTWTSLNRQYFGQTSPWLDNDTKATQLITIWGENIKHKRYLLLKTS